MTTPTFNQWRSGAGPGFGNPPPSLKKRALCALAAYVSGTNPDGTVRGS